MGMSIGGPYSALTEDFDYGYPYETPVQTLPAEFTYFGEVATNKGLLIADHDRKDFRIERGSRRRDSRGNSGDINNRDLGLHGGSRAVNGYYLTFPQMGWHEKQALILEVRVGWGSVLSFYHSWDGYVGDEISLVINGKVYDTFDQSAGHSWSFHSYALPPGKVRITWALETFNVTNTGTVRGGIPDIQSLSTPSLLRYFRLSDISVLEVDHVIYPTVSYAKAIGTGSVTCVTRADYRGKAALVGLSSLEVGVKFSGSIPITGLGSFITDYNHDIRVKQAIVGQSTLTVNGVVQNVHSSEDAGLVIDTHGELTVDTPPDSAQSVLALVRPFKQFSIQMPTPVVVRGKPITPKYFDSQPSTFASANTRSHTQAIDPASVDHVLPHNATYRWVSVDITGALDDPVYAWPERSGSGKNLLSADPFAPTIHPHEHFNEKHLSYTIYAQVVTFYWRYVQHMWVSLGSQPAPFTWQFVGVFSPSAKHQWQHVLCSGGAYPDPAKWTDDVIDGNFHTELDNDQEDSYSGNAFFGLYENGAVIQAQVLGGRFNEFVHGHIDWRPAIYTIVYRPNQTKIFARHRGHKWEKTSTGVVNNDANKFLIGRESLTMSEDHAAHMSLLEVGFWSRELSDKEVLENENYLMGVYKLEQYR